MGTSKTLKVLYAEDDPGMARLFQRRLGRAGYEVDVAYDGRRALDMANSGTYDILCVDHQMPGLTGLEMIRLLSAEGSLPPTIMVTGAGNEVIAVEAMKLGANDYIIKDSQSNYLDLLPHVIDQAVRKKLLVEAKERAESALRDTLEQLESRVTERTAEISEANRRLRDEVTRRINTEHRLMIARDDLENRVRERTRELRDINIRLTAEIRERVQAECACREAKEEWERTFDAIPDLIAIIDRSFTIRRCNKAMAESLRVSPEDVVGGTCYQAMHETDNPPPFCPHAKMLLEGEEATAEVSETTVGGTFMVTASPIRDESGAIYASVHVARDITDRKETEDALRRSDERYRMLVHAMMDGLWIVDSDMRITYANDRLVRLLGYDRSELLGMRCADLAADEDGRLLLGSWELGTPEAGATAEVGLKRKNGEEIIAIVSAQDAPGDDASAIERFGLITDITRLKKMEEELRTFKTLCDTASYGAAITDLDGRVVYVNYAFARMHGYAVEEVVGKPLSIFHTDDQMTHVNRLLEDLKQSGRLETQEVRHARRDGTPFSVLAAGAVITDGRGAPLYLAATAMDISGMERFA